MELSELLGDVDELERGQHDFGIVGTWRSRNDGYYDRAFAQRLDRMTRPDVRPLASTFYSSHGMPPAELACWLWLFECGCVYILADCAHCGNLNVNPCGRAHEDVAVADVKRRNEHAQRTVTGRAVQAAADTFIADNIYVILRALFPNRT